MSVMKGFSVRLFAFGFALGAVGAAAVLAAGAYAGTSQSGAIGAHGPANHVRSAPESGQPVIDWNQVLLSIVNTPGAQPATSNRPGTSRSSTPRSTTR